MSASAVPNGDRDSGPWFDAIDRHEIRLQRCAACGRLRWPPRAHCMCGREGGTWTAVTGRGSVVSWTVTHRAPAGVPTPFVTVVARLDEQADLFIPGGFDGPADGSTLAIGAPVEATFGRGISLAGPTTLLRWRLMGAS